MKKSIRSILMVLAVGLLSVNCEDTEDYLGNWVHSADLNARGRSRATALMIGSKVYLIGGIGYYKTVEYYRDVWAFDAATRTWDPGTLYDSIPETDSVKAPLTTNYKKGRSGRGSGAGFVVDGVAYYGTGLGKDGVYYRDFYRFDPTAEKGSQWTNLETEGDIYPGDEVYGAIGFNVDNIGYIGTGLTKNFGYSNTFYQYDPSKAKGERWSIVENVSAVKRSMACTFTIDNKVYIFGGIKNGILVEDFERFDPNASEGGQRWYKVSQDYRRDYHENTMNRQNCAAFSAGGRGYIVGGQRASGSVLGDTWEYIPSGGRYKRGVWTQRASIEGSSRYGAVGFSYNDIGFVACGQRGTDASSYFEDVWSFYPQEDYDKHTYK